VKALNNAGASLDVTNASGVTPLLLAIRKKSIDVAEYLIDAVRVNGFARRAVL
jgi:ankyrin repeat protein